MLAVLGSVLGALWAAGGGLHAIAELTEGTRAPRFFRAPRLSLPLSQRGPSIPHRPSTSTFHHNQIVCLEEGALFDRATLSIAEAECGNESGKALLVARYRALSRFHLQQYFDSEGDRLRADMLSKFAGRFSVERRILVVDCVIE